MRLPEPLQSAIDQIVERAPPLSLRKARDALTQEYCSSHSSESVFSDEAKRAAYLAVRFPAIYAAVRRVLINLLGSPCRKILDLGAGPGTACWAALELLPEVEEAILIERSPGAIALGKELMKGFPSLKRGDWICQDLESIQEFPAADLAVVSYALGELKRPQLFVDRLWESPVSQIAVLEPGTPRGYQNVLRARDQFIALGAHLIAPCPHAKPCPLKGGDWCHFSARLERTKLHRLLKEGALGYEDEKFSYLIVSRAPVSISSRSRILRHPQKGSGHVRLALCTPEGENLERVASRREKESYRTARDAEWGDPWL